MSLVSVNNNLILEPVEVEKKETLLLKQNDNPEYVTAKVFSGNDSFKIGQVLLVQNSKVITSYEGKLIIKAEDVLARIG